MVNFPSPSEPGLSVYESAALAEQEKLIRVIAARRRAGMQKAGVVDMRIFRAVGAQSHKRKKKEAGMTDSRPPLQSKR
jgi:hypothetical protein